ncbi:unnamed protein product [Lepidochelys kempii]
MLTLSYSCKLPLEHDGAARYVLPTVLHPRYTPHGETHRSPCASATCPTVRPTDPLSPLCALQVGWGEHHPGGPMGPPGGAALHPEPECHAAVAPRHRPRALQLTPHPPELYSREPNHCPGKGSPGHLGPSHPCWEEGAGGGAGGGFWAEGWVPRNGAVGGGKVPGGERCGVGRGVGPERGSLGQTLWVIEGVGDRAVGVGLWGQSWGSEGAAHQGSTPCPPHLQACPHLPAGSLMGDPAVMMTLLPRVPEAVPAQSQPGSSSSCWAAPAARPAPWTQRPVPPAHQQHQGTARREAALDGPVGPCRGSSPGWLGPWG